MCYKWTEKCLAHTKFGTLKPNRRDCTRYDDCTGLGCDIEISMENYFGGNSALGFHHSPFFHGMRVSFAVFGIQALVKGLRVQ